MSPLANHRTNSERSDCAELQDSPRDDQLPTESSRLREVKVETLLEIAKNVVLRIGRDNLMLVAAGVAFYAMTAIFPAIATFVSIYGLFADPDAVQKQIAGFSSLLPAASLKLLTDALQSFAGKNSSTLNMALLVSLGL